MSQPTSQPVQQPVAAPLRMETAAIDASLKGPALVFVAFALIWLLAESLLGFVNAFKLHTPGFLSGPGWLSYGRLQMAESAIMIYGWAMNAGFAAALWLMARLSRVRVTFGGYLLLGALFWNLGVFMGVISILGGGGTGFFRLEFPVTLGLFLFCVYALMAVWAIVVFGRRSIRNLYVSQWYLLAALFFFPWLFSIAQIMLLAAPVRGTLQAIVNAWYAQNLITLWLAPVALALLYYLIPKITARPIGSYYLAPLAFWFWMVFQSWSGVSVLVNAPVPAWVGTAGIVGGVLALIAVVTIGINLGSSLSAGRSFIAESTALKFAVFGAGSFILVHAIEAGTSLHAIFAKIQFTLFIPALERMHTYAFFSMVLFAALYFLLPRLVNRPWPSADLIRVHFWGSAAGIGLVVLALMIGGIVQGGVMNHPDVPFMEVIAAVRPFLYVATIGMVLLLVAHCAFAIHVVLMLVSRERAAEAEELFGNPAAMEMKVS